MIWLFMLKKILYFHLYLMIIMKYLAIKIKAIIMMHGKWILPNIKENYKVTQHFFSKIKFSKGK